MARKEVRNERKAKKTNPEFVWGPTVEALDKLFSKDEVDRILYLGLQVSRAKGNHMSWLLARDDGVKVRETDLVHAQNLIGTMQWAFESECAQLVEKYPKKKEKLLKLLSQVGLVGLADTDDEAEAGLIPEKVEERLASLIGYDELETDGNDDSNPLQPL